MDPPIDIESLKVQQMTLLKLQQRAEKKLRDARQSNLFNPQCKLNNSFLLTFVNLDFFYLQLI